METLERVMGRAGDLGKCNTLISAPVFNSLKEHSRKSDSHRLKRKGKADNSTYASVLDPKTRVLLLKLVNRGFLDEIDGVISSGKEAHIYHASSSDEQHATPHVAVKIYKTTMNEFKNRQQYVEGDPRFKGRYKKQNPRKVIKLWAEKEYLNLMRMHSRGINCPKPLLLKNHVVCMSFIGADDVPAPTLKEARLSSNRLRECYRECVIMMRKLYQGCRLVHADLSEYNILYHAHQLWFIDVSQAVSCDSPNALYFLRHDCNTMTQFFRTRGLTNHMSVKELFDFITDPAIEDGAVDDYLNHIQDEITSRSEQEADEVAVNEKVFLNAFIPRTLDEIVDCIYEEQKNAEGNVFHHRITGMRPDLRGAAP